MKNSKKILKISKKNVINLSKKSNANIKGGNQDANLIAMTQGCTDGCLSDFMHTHLTNCSRANCTADCSKCNAN